MLKQVNLNASLFLGGSEFFNEIGEGGECCCLVAEGWLGVLIIDGVGHFFDECGKEFAYLCVVLLKEFLPCGGGLLDGEDGSVGDFSCGEYYCVSCFGAVGLNRIRESR